jgi:hypothetical protein
MSPYEHTRLYGHFLYGDEPSRIVTCQLTRKEDRSELHFEVEWQPRTDGFKPSNSLLESPVLLEHAPVFLTNFYLGRVRLLAESEGSDVHSI